jgi:hypothetical protein
MTIASGTTFIMDLTVAYSLLLYEVLDQKLFLITIISTKRYVKCRVMKIVLKMSNDICFATIFKLYLEYSVFTY